MRACACARVCVRACVRVHVWSVGKYKAEILKHTKLNYLMRLVALLFDILVYRATDCSGKLN